MGFLKKSEYQTSTGIRILGIQNFGGSNIFKSEKSPQNFVHIPNDKLLLSLACLQDENKMAHICILNVDMKFLY